MAELVVAVKQLYESRDVQAVLDFSAVKQQQQQHPAACPRTAALVGAYSLTCQVLRPLNLALVD